MGGMMTCADSARVQSNISRKTDDEADKGIEEDNIEKALAPKPSSPVEELMTWSLGCACNYWVPISGFHLPMLQRLCACCGNSLTCALHRECQWQKPNGTSSANVVTGACCPSDGTYEGGG